MNARLLKSLLIALLTGIAVAAAAPTDTRIIVNPFPSVRIVSPGGSARAPGGTNTVKVSGLATDDVGVVRVVVEVQGGAVVTAVISGPNPRSVEWQATVPVQVGINTVQVTVFDGSGFSASAERRFVFAKYCQITVAPTVGGSVSRRTGQVRVGSTARFSARSASGFLFQRWLLDSTLIGTGRSVEFIVPDVPAKTLTASFVPNPYAGLSGRYNDRLENFGGAGEGFYNLTLSADGSFSLAASAHGAVIRKKGFIEIDGTVTVSGTTRGRRPVTAALQADLALGGVRLDVLDGDFGTHYTAATKLFANPAGLPARAAVALFPQSGFPPELRGSGFVTLVRKSNGAYQVVGGLADGGKWSASLYPIDSGGAALPVFKKLANGGVLDGTLVWGGTLDTIGGQLNWSRPAQPRSQFSTALNGVLGVRGKAFTRPARGQLIAPLGPGGTASIFEGGVAGTTANFTFKPTHVADFGAVNPANFSLRLSPTTGLYAGKVIDPTSGLARKFRGILVQTVIADAAGDYAMGEGFSVRPGAIDESVLKLFTAP